MRVQAQGLGFSISGGRTGAWASVRIRGEGERGSGARRKSRTRSISLPLKQAGHLRELACTSGSSTALLVAHLLLIAGPVCVHVQVCEYLRTSLRKLNQLQLKDNMTQHSRCI